MSNDSLNPITLLKELREPVSVSLEKCARALLNAGYMGNNSYPEDFQDVAKAVLESAKEQGAKFDYVD